MNRWTSAGKEQDSLWYGCGLTSNAQACEYRMSVDLNINGKTHVACFPSGSSFVDGTRPVGFADNFYSPATAPERWVFATLNDTSSGPQRIIGQRETSAVDSLSAPTYSTLLNYGVGTGIRISSPMPVMYSDSGTLTLGVFFYQTAATGSTKLMQAKSPSPFTTWSTAQLWDLGVRVPEGNEPTPYADRTEGFQEQLRVLIRMPYGSSTTEVRDTFELLRNNAGKFVRTILPNPFDASNLYVIQDSSGQLYEVDESTGARTAVGGAVWAGTTAFTSDDVGLGYATQDGKLWEVNLNDGVRRQLGSESWTGTTYLALGHNTSLPFLYALRSGVLRTVDLATGKTTQTSTKSILNGALALTTMEDAGGRTQLYVVGSDGTLYRYSPDGTWTTLGSTGAWTDAHTMTGNPAQSLLYIAKGPATAQGMRVFRVTPDGTTLGKSGTFSNAQLLTTVGPSSYLMKSRQIQRISGTGSSVGLSNVGTSVWDYSEKGMVGREPVDGAF